jgi:hypothetical protein
MYQQAMVKNGRHHSARAGHSLGVGRLRKTMAVSQSHTHTHIAAGKDIGTIE